MAYSVDKGTIKIPAVGDEVTFNVQKCEVVESTKYKDRVTGDWVQDVKFTAPNGDKIFIGRSTADQKLGRLGFGQKNPDGKTYDIHYGEVDGNTLRFYRDPNPNDASKPYYGIDRVTPEDVSKRPSLAAAAKAAAERVRVAKHLPSEDDGGAMGPTIPGLDDVPPPTDADNPYSEDDGMPPVKAGMAQQAIVDAKAAKRQEIVEAYRFAYSAALDVQGPDATAEAVQAGAATILIAMQKAGLV